MTLLSERLQSPSLRVTFCRRIVSKEMRSFVTSLDRLIRIAMNQRFQHSLLGTRSREERIERFLEQFAR